MVIVVITFLVKSEIQIVATLTYLKFEIWLSRIAA